MPKPYEIKIILKRNITFISERLDCGTLLCDLLYQDDVISQESLEHLQSLRNRKTKQAKMLITMILNIHYGEKITKFWDALQKTHSEVVKIIENHLLNLELELKRIADYVKTKGTNNNHYIKRLPGEHHHYQLNIIEDKEFLMPLNLTSKAIVKMPFNKFRFVDITTKDIVDVVKQLDVENRTVLECTGIAGVGKTVCVKRLISMWINGDLNEFMLIVALYLRETDVKEGLNSIFGKVLGLECEEDSSILEDCMTHDELASKILVIIDGIDEVDIPEESELFELILGQKYPKVKKMVTSRPEANLFKVLNERNWHPHLKTCIHGTTCDEVYNYINRIVKTWDIEPSQEEFQPVMTTVITKFENTFIDFDFLCVPLYLSLLGVWLTEYQSQNKDLYELIMPKTSCTLFNAFIHVLLQAWNERVSPKSGSKNWNYIDNPLSKSSLLTLEIRKNLISFGKMTYESLLQQKYFFTNEDLERHLIEKTHIQQSGLFCVSDATCFYRHKTLQEYMSALYLSANKPEVNSFQILFHQCFSKGEKTLFETFPKLSLVLKFLFGLDPEYSTEIVRELNGRICVAQMIPRDSNLSYSNINLDYEASLFQEIESDELKTLFLDLLANAPSRNRVSNNRKQPSKAVLNLYKQFTQEQNINILCNWFGLSVLKLEGNKWEIQNKNERQNSEALHIETFSSILSIILRNFTFTNVKRLTVGTSEIQNVNIIQAIFPSLTQLEVKNQRVDMHQNNRSVKSTPEVTYGIGNLENIVLQNEYEDVILTDELFRSIFTQENLKSLKLYRVELPKDVELSNISESISRHINLCSMEVCVHVRKETNGVTEVRNLLHVLTNYTNHMQELVLSSESGTDQSITNEVCNLVMQSLKTHPLMNITKLCLFRSFNLENVIKLLDILPHCRLTTFGLAQQELERFINSQEVIGTRCNIISIITQCNTLSHFQVGYNGVREKNRAIAIWEKLTEERRSYYPIPDISISLYDYRQFTEESEEALCELMEEIRGELDYIVP